MPTKNDALAHSLKKGWKNKKNKPQITCLKCGTNKQITKHHVIPKTHVDHYKMKKHDAPTVSLCVKCHRTIEDRILWTEAFVNRGSVGQRLPLHKMEDYWYILSMFIGIQRFSELLKTGKVSKHPTCKIIDE